ncbi:MAG TPA: branched-chain amino acid ABC transporter permease [Mycobacteriales bacterium]|jgi:branched-chain amino acid transport system permease protein|nr:branched-chain amino acid ABC transporter permease [Mycobacteriales bacterium]
MIYWTTILTEACIFAIMALGLNVVWGMSGDFDLGYYGYVALGAYLTIVLTVGKPLPPVEFILGYTLPYPLAVLIAIIVVLIIATLVGLVALRGLRAIYFALTTLGAVSVLYVVVQTYTPLFNGFNGVSGLFDPLGSTLGIGYDKYRYFLLAVCAGILLIVAIFMERLSRSGFGRLLRAVRDEEDAVAAFGRSVYKTKLKAYLVGAGVAGLSGGLFAAFLGSFNPSAWTPAEVLTLAAGVLVGGRGNVKGVILGVFVVYIGFVELTRSLPEVTGHPEFAPALRQVLIGLLIVLFLRFRPQGLIPERLSPDRGDGDRGPGRARGALFKRPDWAAPRRQAVPQGVSGE